MNEEINISEEERYELAREAAYEALLREDYDFALKELEKRVDIQKTVNDMSEAVDWLNSLGYDIDCRELMDLYS